MSPFTVNYPACGTVMAPGESPVAYSLTYAHNMCIFISVPTLYRFKNIAIRIFTHDHVPAHVHAESPDGWAKIDLNTLEVIAAEGFTKGELKIIVEFVSDRAIRLKDKWKEIHE